MRYEEFKESFTREIISHMAGSGILVTPETVTKVNQTLDALSFRRSDSSIGALLYLNDLYEQHEMGRSLPDLVEDAGRIMGDRIREAPEMPQIDHDYIADNLYLTVVNAEMNRDYLSGVPHEMLEDIAVIPRVKISEEASFTIRNDMLAGYGFSRDGLLQRAHANMEHLEFTCQDLESVLFGFGMPVEPGPSSSSGIYVLTNPSGIDGAAAILSERAMHNAREMIGEDFLILPSSRHEVLLVPRSMDIGIRELTDMVREVNRTTVDSKDLLSDHVYRYNSRSGSIKMLEPKAEAPEKKPGLPPVRM